MMMVMGWIDEWSVEKRADGTPVGVGDVDVMGRNDTGDEQRPDGIIVGGGGSDLWLLRRQGVSRAMTTMMTVDGDLCLCVARSKGLWREKRYVGTCGKILNI